MEVAVLEKLSATLNEGKSVRQLSLTEEEAETIKDWDCSPVNRSSTANVSEDELATGNEWGAGTGDRKSGVACRRSLPKESELVELPEEDRADSGISGRRRRVKNLIRATYELLGLRTYFTWFQGNPRLDDYSDDSAAGVIHLILSAALFELKPSPMMTRGRRNAAKEKGLVRSR